MTGFSAGRLFFTILIGGLLSVPASAAEIVQTIPLQENFGDFTPYSIVGNTFNPDLGTLTAVEAAFSGTYTPIDYDAFGPSPGTLTTSFFTSLASGFPTVIGSQTVAPTGNCTSLQTSEGCTYTGVPINFSVSPIVTLPLSDFISAIPGMISLADFGFNSHVMGAGGGGSDDTTFMGNLQLTYDYSPVPEPAALILVLSGMFGLLFFHRFTKSGKRKIYPPGIATLA